MVLEKLEPRNTWEIFENIFIQSYRPSGQEGMVKEKIKAWLNNFKMLNLEVSEDEIGNMLIRIPPSRDQEDVPAILIQGHLDMVYEKDLTSEVDFARSPIPVKISDDGEWVEAHGTTLGADNGIGVAVALSIIPYANDGLVHGPIEILLTTSEETGLDGAFNLEPEKLGISAQFMVNVDSEDLGIIIIGSAGGGSVTFTKRACFEPTSCNENLIFFTLKIQGLKGGHSGINIHENRGNALKIASRILSRISEEHPILLSSWEGGTRTSAIPRECEVRFAVSINSSIDIKKIFNDEKLKILNYYRQEDVNGQVLEPKLDIELESSKIDKILPHETSKTIIEMVNALPRGPQAYSPVMKGLVETSCNPAIIKLNSSDEDVIIRIGVRSAIDSERDALRRKIGSIGNLANWKIKMSKGYPSWPAVLGTKFVKFVKERYDNILQRPCEIKAVHAGLECGIIKQKVRSLGNNVISIGPTILNAHTPQERVRIKDVKILKDLLTSLVKDIKLLR
ncbi:MAG: beta-Ala-His dipeptidase [Promethearchaeota archaeon]